MNQMQIIGLKYFLVEIVRQNGFSQVEEVSVEVLVEFLLKQFNGVFENLNANQVQEKRHHSNLVNVINELRRQDLDFKDFQNFLE